MLESLKNILQTPIKPFVPADNSDLVEGHAPSPSPHPDDLPSQLTKVIGKGTDNQYIVLELFVVAHRLAVMDLAKSGIRLEVLIELS